jgi:hypothetical protein
VKEFLFAIVAFADPKYKRQRLLIQFVNGRAMLDGQQIDGFSRTSPVILR